MPTTSLLHARDTLNAFRVEAVWLRSVYDTSCALFSSGKDTDELLRRVAPQFFADMNHMFVEYWVLAVCRITDPPKTMGRENLTVSTLTMQLDSLGVLTKEICCEAEGLHNYRALLNNARNRVVSHADKETFLNPSLLGDHAEDELVAFLEHLQSFSDLVGEALGIGPLDFRSMNGPGDAYDLVRALKRSI